MRQKALEPRLLILTKANSRSTVHRPVYLDYVGVKMFDRAGEVVGERRFLGLFTATAYTQSVEGIPVLDRKVRRVREVLGFSRGSHGGQDLMQFLETYPRDELFPIEAEELTAIAVAVLRLQERRATRLFLRRDPYGRFVSCLVYLPRDRYTTDVRLRIQQVLQDAVGGASVDYTARVSESVLARLHFVVRVARGQRCPRWTSTPWRRRSPRRPVVGRRVRDALVAASAEAEAHALRNRYPRGLPRGLQGGHPRRAGAWPTCRDRAA